MKATINVLPMPEQDRAIAIPTAGGYLVAVADGAGGKGGGAVAAGCLIAFVANLSQETASADWFAALCAFDDELSVRPLGGQTTGVVAFVDSKRILGASVGDSSAWLISRSGLTIDLTARQRRRPLPCCGDALPVQFEAERLGTRVVLASDGLFKCAPADRICALAVRGSVVDAADALVNCLRLPSGNFQDDVAVVLISE